MRLSLILPFALILVSLPLAAARADWVLVPKNSHQLYQTYGLFIDEQTIIVNYEAARYYGSIGGSFALFGNPDTPAHPQLVILSSVNAAMIFSDSGRIYSDEIDVHAGGAFEFALNPMMRLSLGGMHYSGHAADGVVDRDFLDVNANLGDNLLFARFVYDLGNYVRAGVTFEPVIHGGPDMNFFGANEFAEYHPWGGADEPHKPSPYVAAAMKQAGSTLYGQQNTLNLQVGAYIGNHFTNEYRPTLRAVAGYYTGADPRLKYWIFKNTTQSFFYVGLMFDF